MKDSFEEKLRDRLQELEQELAEGDDMLNREAIWTRIEAGKQPAAKQPWRPRIIQLAAALLCCLGISLYIQYQQQTTTSADQGLSAIIAAPAIQSSSTDKTVEEIITKEDNTDPTMPAGNSVPRVETTLVTAQKKQVPVNNTPVASDLKPPGVIIEQPVKIQKAREPQLAVIYLSDLERESPAITAAQKKREPGRVARYIKSNLDDYASSITPNEIISQISNK